MKKAAVLASICITGALQLAAQSAFAQDMMIISVFDGPLTGGTPKGVQLKVINDIADLSEYTVNAFSNGNETNTSVFQFPAEAASAGSYLYLTTNHDQFSSFFGLPAQYQTGEVAINGDDPVGLLKNDVLIDVFGPPSVDGTGEPWEYKDGWAARKPEINAPNPIFDLTEWNFGGVDALEGGTTNDTAATPLPTIPPTQIGPDPKANGESCGTALDCMSGHCIEGVCCDTACGEGDTLDCLSCLGVNTGGADGTCAPIGAQSECGPAPTGECMAGGLCNDAGECVPGAPKVAGTECGNAETDCMQGDRCDGAGSCVAGQPKPDTVPCGDPTADECNLPDFCDGAGMCENRVVDEGTACGSEDNSACDRADTCDGAGSCRENLLTADDDCDDRVMCTVGLCDETQACSVDDSGCVEICKDAEFWATRPEVSSELLEQLDPIEVCGSRVASAQCAIEGLCVADEASPEALLRQQLLVTAMNCKAYNGQEDCSRSEIQALFDACNQICTGSDEAAMGACTAQLACRNAGGTWFQPTGLAGECELAAAGEGCAAASVDANAMLPAAGAPELELCSAAQSSPEGLAEACEALPGQVPNNDGDLDGIRDDRDECPGTGLGATVDRLGCDILHYCECERDWRRGEFMDCVREGLGEWEQRGIISRNERRSESSKMSASECGLRRRRERNPFRDRLGQIEGLPEWLLELLDR